MSPTVAGHRSELELTPDVLDLHGCSARGTLSFNWRLVLAPFEVLDYILVHELCHLREPNHSPRFWRLVASRRADWRRRRDWLTDQGPELLAFHPGL